MNNRHETWLVVRLHIDKLGLYNVYYGIKIE